MSEIHFRQSFFKRSMNPERKQKLINFTKDFLNRPMNEYFSHPVNLEEDNLPNYLNIVKRPMDLSTVIQNLQNNIYKTTSEWYSDMSLIYENAINYHKETIFGIMARYLLQEFKKEASGYNITNINEWNVQYQKMLTKLGRMISESKISLGRDDLPNVCIKKAINYPKIEDPEIKIMMEKMKKLLSKDDFRQNVVYIIRHSQKDFTFVRDESDKVYHISLEKLAQPTLKALNLLVNSYNLIY